MGMPAYHYRAAYMQHATATPVAGQGGCQPAFTIGRKAQQLNSSRCLGHLAKGAWPTGAWQATYLLEC
jgi:hypothetical protein